MTGDSFRRSRAALTVFFSTRRAGSNFGLIWCYLVPLLLVVVMRVSVASLSET